MDARIEKVSGPEDELISQFVQGYSDPAGGWTQESIVVDLQQRLESGALTHDQVLDVALKLGIS